MNDWIVKEDCFNENSVELNGNRFLIANGYMGYRGTLEEYQKDNLVACTIAGVYDRYDKKWRELVNVPNGLFIRAFYNGEILSPINKKIKCVRHEQGLNLKEAIHFRKSIFEVDNGKLITISSTRFASAYDHHLLIMKYSIKSNFDCEVTIESGLDADIWEINGPHFKDIKFEQNKDIFLLQLLTNEEKYITVGETFGGYGKYEKKFLQNKYLRTFEVKLEKDKELSFEKFFLVFHDKDSSDQRENVLTKLSNAAKEGYQYHEILHKNIWQKRWEISDVEIDGDEIAQKAIRFSLYHLMCIAPYHSDRISVPARGLSGQMYKGAVFWDTELFMLPFYIANFPSVARNVLMYRYWTLNGAKRKAKEYGFDGAFFAWESQDNGDDACTLFNVTDVITKRPVRTYFRDKQIHISADIVWGIMQYYLITGDESILLDGGAEIIFECAKFYYSYLYYSPFKDRYDVLDITGPDEYHERVHNNAFTNRMVKYVFEVSRFLYSLLKQKYPHEANAVIQKTQIENYLSKMTEIVEKIYIKKPNKNLLIEQFDGYFNLQDVSIDELKSKMLHPYEYLGGGSGLATQTQVIKQADVVVMLNLFCDEFDKRVLKANWEYYNERTEHGSTLSYCMYGLLAAKIGEIDKAYEYFMATALIDFEGRYKQYVGDLYIGGTHPAANGGTWLVAIKGFAGVQFKDEFIIVNPHLPNNWRKMYFKLIYKGNLLEFMIGSQSIRIRLLGGSFTEKVKLYIQNTLYILTQEKSLEIPI